MGRTEIKNLCAVMFGYGLAAEPLHTKTGRRQLYTCYTVLFAAVSLILSNVFLLSFIFLCPIYLTIKKLLFGVILYTSDQPKKSQGIFVCSHIHLPYSYLNASMGSIFAALFAG